MLATCCRVGEISQARWSDANLSAGTWCIPAEHAKNGREHLVHLSPFATAQFERIRTVSHDSKWLFPNPSGKDHVSTKAL